MEKDGNEICAENKRSFIKRVIRDMPISEFRKFYEGKKKYFYPYFAKYVIAYGRVDIYKEYFMPAIYIDNPNCHCKISKFCTDYARAAKIMYEADCSIQLLAQVLVKSHDLCNFYINLAEIERPPQYSQDLITAVQKILDAEEQEIINNAD